MRITHVCKVWYPRTTGVTVHVDCLARWMAAAGHDLAVVTYDLTGELSPGMDFAEERQNGYKVARVRPGDDARFQKTIEETRPEVVHAHGIWEHAPPAWRAARGLGARFALTAHGTWQFLASTPGMESPLRRLRFWAYYHGGWRRMVRDADAVIALNAIEEKAHRRLGAKNVHRIPNGVDCEEFWPEASPLPSEEFNLPDRYFLFAGSIQTQKGVFTLLESLRGLKTEGIFPEVMIAGDGPESDKAQSMVRENQLPVRFLGRVARSRMPALMANADLFVLPSVHEPFATVYLEAMAAGTPCVGTKTGGTPEIIEDGRTGFLVPKGDEIALSSVLKKIWTEPEDARSMGAAARARALERFDWRILAPRLLEAYGAKG